MVAVISPSVLSLTARNIVRFNNPLNISNIKGFPIKIMPILTKHDRERSTVTAENNEEKCRLMQDMNQRTYCTYAINVYLCSFFKEVYSRHPMPDGDVTTQRARRQSSKMTCAVGEVPKGETVHVLRNTQFGTFSEAVGTLDARFLEALIDCPTVYKCCVLVDIEGICAAQLHHQ